MKKLISILTLFVLMVVPIFSTTINIPSDYPTIQAGIDASSDGDTVLVTVGTYVENINFNGKNIVVQGEDRETTIVDGNQSGSVVTFENGEDSTAVLTGFTIKNGNATMEGGGIRIQDSDPYIKNLNIFDCNGNQYGGGIYFGNSNSILEYITISNNEAERGGGVYLNSSLPVLTNVNITTNVAHYGGGGVFAYQGSFIFQGVTILGNSTETTLFWIPSDGGGLYLSEVDSPILIDVTIKNNSADDAGGGIYFSVYSVPVFDTSDRCNIYLNTASVGNDLDATDNFYGPDADSILNVVLDTFTVIQPTEYYANPLGNFSFDIVSGFLDQEDSGELYVSPEGNNSNSGLSLDEPLRTITYALSVIFVDENNPGFIHLGPGLYSSESNGEIFPLNIISNVTILGSGSEETIIDAGFRPPSVNNVRHYQGINDGSYFEENGFIDRTSLHINVSDINIYEAIYFDEDGNSYREDDQSRDCPDGYVDDCSGDGDCCLETWIGDGYPDCEDQIWACDLTCYENDGGDCNDPTMPSSVIIMNNIENVFIKDLKIKGGAGSYAGNYPQSGGGINSVNSHSELENITLSKNVAMFAGGIITVSSNMVLKNVVVDSNYSYNQGGGMKITMSDVSLENGTISNNAAMEGGGMYIEDDDERVRSNASYNTLLSRSSLTLSGVVIKDNSASYKGGGIYNARDGGSGIVFDHENRISIYSNTAISGNDLFSTSPLDIVLDTFTVTTPSDHLAYPTPLYSFDILNGVLADVEIDVEHTEFYYAPDTGYVIVEFPVGVLNGDIGGVTFEWDFNRDGVTDWTEIGNSSAMYTFTEIGFQTADLLYTDPEGNSNRLTLNFSVEEFDSDASGFEEGVVLNWGFGDIQPILIASTALEFMAAGDQLHIIDMEGILEQGCISADDTGPVSVGHYVYDGSSGDSYYTINTYNNYENCNPEFDSTWEYMNTGEIPVFVIYDASEYSYYSVEVSDAVPFHNNDISVIETISALNLIELPLSLQSGESLTQAHSLVQNATVNGEPLVGAEYDGNGELTNEPDIIYVFRDSVCVGSQMWTGSYTDIIINGNDGGNSFPGFVDGNQMSFMHYDAGADAYNYLTPEYQSGIGAFGTPNGGMLSGMNFHLVLYDQSEDITYTYPQLFEGWYNNNGATLEGYSDWEEVYNFTNGDGFPDFTFDDFNYIGSPYSGTVLGTVTINGIPAESGDWSSLPPGHYCGKC